MDNLTMTQRRVGDVSIMDLDGKITIGGTSTQFRQTVRRLVEEGERQIILSMSGVSTIDSSGLGEIVSGYAALQRSGGSLRLANLSDRTMNLMTMTKLYTVFDIFDSEHAAVASFKSEPAAVEASTASAGFKLS